MKTLSTYLIFLAGLLPAFPVEAQTLSLEECREAAAMHNRTLQDSRFDLEAARQTRPEAFTNYLPKIYSSGGAFLAQDG